MARISTNGMVELYNVDNRMDQTLFPMYPGDDLSASCTHPYNTIALFYAYMNPNAEATGGDDYNGGYYYVDIEECGGVYGGYVPSLSGYMIAFDNVCQLTWGPLDGCFVTAELLLKENGEFIINIVNNGIANSGSSCETGASVGARGPIPDNGQCLIYNTDAHSTATEGALEMAWRSTFTPLSSLSHERTGFLSYFVPDAVQNLVSTSEGTSAKLGVAVFSVLALFLFLGSVYAVKTSYQFAPAISSSKQTFGKASSYDYGEKRWEDIEVSTHSTTGMLSSSS